MTFLINPYRFAGAAGGGGIGGGTSVPSRYLRLIIWGPVGDSQYYSIAELRLRETSGGPNVATGATITASGSHGSFPPSGAIDGNTATWWNSQQFPSTTGGSWLLIDFGSGVTRSIKEVEVVSRSDGFNQTPQIMQVQSSNDLVTFTEEFLLRPATWTASQTQTFTKPDLAAGSIARYYEVFITASQRNDGSGTGGQFALTNGGANLLIGATAGADSTFSATYTADKAIDTDSASFWLSTAHQKPWWWWADFGSGAGIALPATFQITTRSDVDYTQGASSLVLYRGNSRTAMDAVARCVPATWTSAGQTQSFSL